MRGLVLAHALSTPDRKFAFVLLYVNGSNPKLKTAKAIEQSGLVDASLSSLTARNYFQIGHDEFLALAQNVASNDPQLFYRLVQFIASKIQAPDK